MKEPTKPEKRLTPQAERVLNRCMGAFFSEIRTPLTSIIGWSNIMVEREDKIGSLNENQREYLTYIHQNGKRVLEMVENLLDINRLISGRLYLDIEEVNLNQLIEQVIPVASVKIQQNVPDYLPNIWADCMRVQQVLEWAFQEAIRIIYPGEERAEVLTVSCDDSWVIFSITAIGSGNLRYRFDSDDPESFFSRSIIEMHGGQMWVNAQEELKQLEISFTLPIEQNKPHPE